MKSFNSVSVCRQWRVISLLLYFCMYSALGYAQNRVNVSGTVADQNGEPLIVVSIVIRGATATGTITDIDGKFSLPNVSSDAVLVVSYIGYIAQEVPLNGQSVLNILLAEDVRTLDEVVVIGYGTMRKKDLTGSIVQIRPDKIADENPKTVQDILRGTPGLNVGFDASAKGGGSMQIRGQRSVYNKGGHNDPLIILDGMMFYGELSEINPDDIGQIDILKDASAASVYGAKSANGVIIITTKKGALGKPKVSFTSNIGFATMGANREIYGPEGYLQFYEDWYTTPTHGVNSETGRYEAYQTTYKDKPGYYASPNNLSKYGTSLDDWRAYGNNAPGTSDNAIWAERLGLKDKVMQNFLDGKTFDWYKHSFRTGVNQDYNISISGANDKMNYYMSLGYLSNEGVVKGNDYRAIRSNMKLEGQVNKWLTISANVNFQDRSDGDIAVDLSDLNE
ncbi:MAG: TonB-dependent receptor plug domain-containing protein, partial [Prevotellaceae bacterium]|nr:TonB-dependent receptor plug domain-containing protein [Prevotellaceae bacterium]